MPEWGKIEGQPTALASNESLSFCSFCPSERIWVGIRSPSPPSRFLVTSLPKRSGKSSGFGLIDRRSPKSGGSGAIPLKGRGLGYYSHVFMVVNRENSGRSFQKGFAWPFCSILLSAPRIFTKVLGQALAPLRLQSILIVPYLDDLLVVGHSAKVLSKELQVTIQHLVSLGWFLKKDKPSLKPLQVT